HYHLLVETPQANLSQAIKWINVSYATYFNRKHNRSGHLFQGRFKSLIVDADEYLKPLSRYIHLNPVRAKMVESLDSYYWSSYPVFIGKRKAEKRLETDWLLSLFGKNPKAASKIYRSYVEDIDLADVENPQKDLVGGLVLGSAEFVAWIKQTFFSKKSGQKEIPQLKEMTPAIELSLIVKGVCDEFGCDAALIRQKGLKRNLARDVAIYIAREITGKSAVDLGGFFGSISGAGITVRRNYISKQIEQNRRLKGRINRIKKEIVNN
ncbi:MAG: transposase, partial [Candidatus Omnitrophica bacterium]|nr:transposase [Candidatus Omnitrophota bacterium]